MSSTAASLVRERETSTGTVELSVCDAGQRVLLTAPRKRATVVSLFGGQGFGKSTVGNGLAAALAESQGTTQPLHLPTGNGLSHTTRGVDVALAAGRVLLDVEGHGDVSDTQVHDLRMQNIVAGVSDIVVAVFKDKIARHDVDTLAALVDAAALRRVAGPAVPPQPATPSPTMRSVAGAGAGAGAGAHQGGDGDATQRRVQLVVVLRTGRDCAPHDLDAQRAAVEASCDSATVQVVVVPELHTPEELCAIRGAGGPPKFTDCPRYSAAMQQLATAVTRAERAVCDGGGSGGASTGGSEAPRGDTRLTPAELSKVVCGVVADTNGHDDGFFRVDDLRTRMALARAELHLAQPVAALTAKVQAMAQKPFDHRSSHRADVVGAIGKAASATLAAFRTQFVERYRPGALQARVLSHGEAQIDAVRDQAQAQARREMARCAAVLSTAIANAKRTMLGGQRRIMASVTGAETRASLQQLMQRNQAAIVQELRNADVARLNSNQDFGTALRPLGDYYDVLWGELVEHTKAERKRRRAELMAKEQAHVVSFTGACTLTSCNGSHVFKADLSRHAPLLRKNVLRASVTVSSTVDECTVTRSGPIHVGLAHRRGGQQQTVFHWRGGGGKYHQITALFDATTYVLEVHNHSGGWGNGSVHLRGVKNVEVTVVRQGHYGTAYENEELPSH